MGQRVELAVPVQVNENYVDERAARNGGYGEAISARGQRANDA